MKKEVIKSLISLAIRGEIMKLEGNEKYYVSSESGKNAVLIFEAIEDEFKYYAENDEQAAVYFLKASHTEIWQYYLDVIIPAL